MSAVAGQPLVRIRNLRFRYPGADHDVLRIPALDIRGQGLTAVTGPSGAGKSTLVELLAGTLSEHYDGTLEVLGHDWSSISKDSDRQRLLRRIGLIPQDYASIPGKSVRQALIQDLADAQVPRAEHEERIDAALKEVGLEVFADREVTRLSGGQRQRVAVARMLARDVDLVIADEPTANLDPELVEGVMALLSRLGERVPVIVITHDSHVAALCDRTVLMQPNVPYESSIADIPERTGFDPRRRRVILALLGLIGAVGLVGAAALALPKLVSRSTTSSKASSNPTVTTSSSLTAPVVSCVAPGQRTGADQPMAQPSGSVTLLSSPPSGVKLVAYSDGVTTVLAPAGWTCTSVIGANGADTVTAVPKGNNAQAPTEIVTGGQDSGSAGRIYADTCNYFLKVTGPNPPFECSPPPNGEINSRLSEWAVKVEDVPGSGVVPMAPTNTSRIYSVVVYIINTAADERCVLNRKDVCDFVLGEFAEAQKPVTKVHVYALSADAKVTSTEPGSCFATSIAAPRAGAYRCNSGQSIIDPCFLRPDPKLLNGTTFLCPSDLSNPGSGVLLSPASLQPGTTFATNLPTDPFTITLADGRQCGVVTGAGIGGYPYGCGGAAGPFTYCQQPIVGPHEDVQTVCGALAPQSETVVNATRIAVVEAWY